MFCEIDNMEVTEELIEKVDRDGYDWLKEELGIVDEINTTPRVSLGSCAINKRGNN